MGTNTPKSAKVRTRFFKMFIKRQETTGVFLMFSALAALLWANSPWGASYVSLWDNYLSFSFGDMSAKMSLRHFVDDVLMAFFFLVVGCELKRECLEGELSSPAHIKLPIFAAFGGMVVPALLFVGVNLAFPAEGKSYMNGWAIPTATDIAFALGILAMMKSYVPVSLKAFLVALAIIDDLGAVLLIGLFYTADLNVTALASAALVMTGLWALNRRGVRSLIPYAILGVLLWFAVFKSGIHATLSGVLLALFLPLRAEEDEQKTAKKKTWVPSPLKLIEGKLHLWVAYLILPLFALANAGISLKGLTFDMFLCPLTLGIIAGLFLGKQIGVLAATWLSIKFRIAEMPYGAKFHHIYGLSLLCGVGFTMSLFISSLAFSDQETIMSARLGVLTASVLSALSACLVWYVFGRKKKAADEKRLVASGVKPTAA